MIIYSNEFLSLELGELCSSFAPQNKLINHET